MKRALLALGIAAALTAALALLGGPRSHRVGAPWDFPARSWVDRHEIDTQGERRIETLERWTVMERAGGRVSVEIRRSARDAIPSIETISIGLLDEIDSLEGSTAAGRESVTAGDLRLEDCEVREKTGEGLTTRLWVHPRCPWPVKGIHQRRGTSPETIERTWTGEVETIRVGGRDLACHRFRERRQVRGSLYEEAELWLSPEVPGFTVRHYQTLHDPGGEAGVRTETTAYFRSSFP